MNLNIFECCIFYKFKMLLYIGFKNLYTLYCKLLLFENLFESEALDLFKFEINSRLKPIYWINLEISLPKIINSSNSSNSFFRSSSVCELIIISWNISLV